MEKDRNVLLNFYDFPAEHSRHIRTSNPIESTFATVRLRTAKVRNCFSSKTVLSMAFKCGEVYFDEPEVAFTQEIIKTLEDQTDRLSAVA